jgi:hypothetical protein
MTPREKAKELVEKMYVKYEPGIEDKSGIYYFNMNFDIAKQSALIAVDEILDLSIGHFDDLHPFVNFWQQVKQEIINQ